DARELSALERSSDRQARRGCPRVAAGGPPAGRLAAARAGKPRLARWPEAVRFAGGGRIGDDRIRLPGERVLKGGMALERLRTDILILGSGGAGLFAALHSHAADPALAVTIATKGLLGKCGCTRMVQGGYNVAVHRGDSVERHFMDTIEGGKWLPDQDLAWTLVTKAIERIHELENEIGCFFDRNPDGTLHGK